MSLRSPLSFVALAFVVLALGVTIPAHAVAISAAAQAHSGDLAAAARGLQAAGRLHVLDVDVPATSETLAFDLERFEVFTPDADIVVHGDGGSERHLPRPDTVYLKGTVTGEPGSRVFLESHPDGHVRGYVTRGEDEMYLVDNEQEAPPAAGRPAHLMAERADNALLEADRKAKPWQCEQDALPTPPQPLAGLDLSTVAAGATAADITKAGFTHTARVAIETDHEFYALFNSTATATAYIGNLLGYASVAAYEPEIGVSLQVSSVSLWATTSDPWDQASTSCGLYQFGYYWNKNKTGVNRTIAHFLSGKPNGGGVAWIGVLCQNPASGNPPGFNFTSSSTCPGIPTDKTWFGDYGYTGNLFGNFNISNPQVVWDLSAVAHEIGHNFNSPHSHCYGGIGGSSSPIDGCYNGEAATSGCYASANTLPGPSSLSGGTAGGHDGTIMSYCHLLGGGMGNLTFTFGSKAGFGFGVQPQREAARMSSYVTSTASANPTCLAPGASLLASSFENGTGGWLVH